MKTYQCLCVHTELKTANTDCVHLVRRPLTGLLYQPWMIDDVCAAVGGMRIGRGNLSIWWKPTSVPLCPLQITHDLTWPRTRVAAVGSRRLTAWPMARPTANRNEFNAKIKVGVHSGNTCYFSVQKLSPSHLLSIQFNAGCSKKILALFKMRYVGNPWGWDFFFLNLHSGGWSPNWVHSASYWPIVPAPAPLCPPQIPLDQTRDWNRAAAVGSQRLIASAMARPG
jgi:hypothetical protein